MRSARSLEDVKMTYMRDGSHGRHTRPGAHRSASGSYQGTRFARQGAQASGSQRAGGARHFKPASDSPQRYSSRRTQARPAQSAGRVDYYGGSPKRKRSKAPLVILIVVLVLVIAVAVSGTFALLSAKRLKGQASSVMQDVTLIVDSVKSQDFAGASQAAQRVAGTADDMSGELSSPLWTVASFIPVYGQDIKGIQTLAKALDDVSADALVPLTQTLEANPPSNLISTDKKINLEAVTTLLGAVESAAPAVQSCTDTVESLPQMHISKLEEMIAPAKEKLASMNGLFQKAADLAPVAGSILGAGGDRTYLLAAQNTAEMRASGGFPGSVGTLSIKGGQISLGDFSKVYDVMAEKTPDSVAPTDEEKSLFGEGFMTVARDAGMDPDFTRVAAIWKAAYEEKTGVHVDGVISITPSVVQSILGIAGSIALSDGTVLDGSNAARVLQHDIYWKYLSGRTTGADNDIADALFAQAAGSAFDKLFASLNSGTMMKFASTMLDGMENRTVMFWLANADEQSKLASLDCSGTLNADSSKPEVGTFFSLWIGSKMGWYIDINNQVVSSAQNADGTTTYQVKTTFANTATQNDVRIAGDYITGYLPGYDRDNLYPYLWVYAPAGGSISNFQATNGAQFTETSHEGLQVFRSALPNLRAGESIECTYDVTTAAGAEELAFYGTPTLTSYR